MARSMWAVTVVALAIAALSADAASVRSSAHSYADKVYALAAKYNCEVEENSLDKVLTEVLRKHSDRVDEEGKKCADEFKAIRKTMEESNAEADKVLNQTTRSAQKTRLKIQDGAQQLYDDTAKVLDSDPELKAAQGALAEAKDMAAKAAIKHEQAGAAHQEAKEGNAAELAAINKLYNRSVTEASTDLNEATAQANAFKKEGLTTAAGHLQKSQKRCNTTYQEEMDAFDVQVPHIEHMNSLVADLKICLAKKGKKNVADAATAAAPVTSFLEMRALVAAGAEPGCEGEHGAVVSFLEEAPTKVDDADLAADPREASAEQRVGDKLAALHAELIKGKQESNVRFHGCLGNATKAHAKTAKAAEAVASATIQNATAVAQEEEDKAKASRDEATGAAVVRLGSSEGRFVNATLAWNTVNQTVAAHSANIDSRLKKIEAQKTEALKGRDETIAQATAAFQKARGRAEEAAGVLKKEAEVDHAGEAILVKEQCRLTKETLAKEIQFVKKLQARRNAEIDALDIVQLTGSIEIVGGADLLAPGSAAVGALRTAIATGLGLDADAITITTPGLGGAAAAAGEASPQARLAALRFRRTLPTKTVVTYKAVFSKKHNPDVTPERVMKVGETKKFRTAFTSALIAVGQVSAANAIRFYVPPPPASTGPTGATGMAAATGATGAASTGPTGATGPTDDGGAAKEEAQKARKRAKVIEEKQKNVDKIKEEKKKKKAAALAAKEEAIKQAEKAVKEEEKVEEVPAAAATGATGATGGATGATAAATGATAAAAPAKPVTKAAAKVAAAVKAAAGPTAAVAAAKKVLTPEEKVVKTKAITQAIDETSCKKCTDGFVANNGCAAKNNDIRLASFPEDCRQGELAQCQSLAKAKCDDLKPNLPSTADATELAAFAASKTVSQCVCHAKDKKNGETVEVCESNPKTTEGSCKGNAACEWKCPAATGAAMARFMSSLRRFL